MIAAGTPAKRLDHRAPSRNGGAFLFCPKWKIEISILDRPALQNRYLDFERDDPRPFEYNYATEKITHQGKVLGYSVVNRKDILPGEFDR